MIEEGKKIGYSQDLIEKQISELISDMTLREKVGMCHGEGMFKSGGIARLGIPALKMTDGPHGIREELDESCKPLGREDDAATYFASLIALAATWNPELSYRFGCGIGAEARARGKDVLLAPGVNIVRTPLCGRNFEYLGEDPHLSSKMAVPYIKGVQEQDISACVKHFAVNNQETERLNVNVEVSERALNEIYFPAFRAAVQEGNVYAVMGAFNKLRNQHCCHNHYLLNTVLRKNWGFDGLVVSDWGGTNDMKEAALNGLDIEMGTLLIKDKYYMAEALLEAVENGEIDEDIINEKIRRILRIMYRINMFNPDSRKKEEFNTEDHRNTAFDIARESIVLLKNSESLLPLDENKIKSVAIIGENAFLLHSYGGGSSQVKAYYEVSPIEGIKKRLGQNIKISIAKGYCEDAIERKKLIDEAVEAAGNADIAIVFGGLSHEFDNEGKDRDSMKLPYGQDDLIRKVYAANSRTVVLLIGGSPVEMMPWSDMVPAIVQAWYCGMESGNVIAGMLFGDFSPSGKLPVTFPQKLEDSPAHAIGEYPGKENVNYCEGIYVGYRYFDTKKVEPLFCFGHGLSYSTFEYGNFEVSGINDSDDQIARISFTVKNSGEKEGAETSQIYIRHLNPSVERPYRELKAFEKVFLEPGEERNVSVILEKSDLSYFDTIKAGFVCEPGIYEIQIGSSSRDIRLKGRYEML